MTVKEFYDFAVKHHLKNADIVIDYECSDDWYSAYMKVEKHHLKQGNKQIVIYLNEAYEDEEER